MPVRDTEGECRTKRELVDAPAEPLAPVCDTCDRLASEEVKRGLPVDVTARDRLPLPNGPVA